MNDFQLYYQIINMPEQIKSEVSDFIEFLISKNKIITLPQKRTFGYAKGFFIMKNNFDEPIEGFKDYI